MTQNSASTTPQTTPPTITVNGDNPTVIDVGATHTDLGATAKDAAGHDLGLKYFLNGALVSNIVLDTSAVATDTIAYVATDTWGNTATSTRTVIIEPNPSTVAATTTPAALPSAATTTTTATTTAATTSAATSTSQ